MMTPEQRAAINAFQQAITRAWGIYADAIAGATDQWLRQLHAPRPDGYDGGPVCIHASHGRKRPVPWPCDVELAACDRIDAREERKSGKARP